MEAIEQSRGVSKTVRFVHDGANVFAELSGTDNSIQRRFITGGVDQLFARIDYTTQLGVPTKLVYWYLTDRQGSVLRVDRPDGYSVSKHQYDAFGVNTHFKLTHLRSWQIDPPGSRR